jgi:hypothetical protein
MRNLKAEPGVSPIKLSLRAKTKQRNARNGGKKCISAKQTGTSTIESPDSPKSMSVQYPLEAFELLSKLPRNSRDVYQAEDDDL